MTEQTMTRTELDSPVEGEADDVQGYGYGVVTGLPAHIFAHPVFPIVPMPPGASGDTTSLGSGYDGGDGSGGGVNVWWEGSDNGEHTF